MLGDALPMAAPFILCAPASICIPLARRYAKVSVGKNDDGRISDMACGAVIRGQPLSIE